MRGEIDPDWFFLLSGTIFGFQVINDVKDLNYSMPSKPVKSDTLKEIIEEKLLKEIDQQVNTCEVHAFSVLLYKNNRRWEINYRL